MLYCDIKAAFPSIAQHFLFTMLTKVFGNHPFVHILAELCKHNVGQISLFGCLWGEAALCSGIRQGCPASGSLFALAFDGFILMVSNRIPRVNLYAFADDVAILMAHLLQDLPTVFMLFEVLIGWTWSL